MDYNILTQMFGEIKLYNVCIYNARNKILKEHM